jgi:hypothetical protein
MCRFIHWWTMRAVCQSVTMHLSVPSFLSEGPNPSKYVRINEAMNDVLTCHMFHLLCLVNTFRCKIKTINKMQLWLYRTFRHQNKERIKQGFCIFPKWTHCNMQLGAVLTSSYMTLFRALIPVEHRVTWFEECWTLVCVCSVFSTATLRTYNCKFHT